MYAFLLAYSQTSVPKWPKYGYLSGYLATHKKIKNKFNRITAKHEARF